jgi:hypothetical protein
MSEANGKLARRTPSSVLTRFEAARRALAEAKTIDEVLHVRRHPGGSQRSTLGLRLKSALLIFTTRPRNIGSAGLLLSYPNSSILMA